MGGNASPNLESSHPEQFHTVLVPTRPALNHGTRIQALLYDFPEHCFPSHPRTCLLAVHEMSVAVMPQDGTLPRREIQTSTTPPAQSPLARHFQQLGLFCAGAGFLAASVAVSRRSVLRMRKTSYPHFYWSNRTPASRMDTSDRGLVAVQALGLATLNVTGFGIMLIGGIGWAFDLSSIEELRHRTRKALTRPGNFSTEDEKKVEAEMEKILDAVYEKLGMEKPEKLDWESLDQTEEDKRQRQQEQQQQENDGKP